MQVLDRAVRHRLYVFSSNIDQSVVDRAGASQMSSINLCRGTPASVCTAPGSWFYQGSGAVQARPQPDDVRACCMRHMAELPGLAASRGGGSVPVLPAQEGGGVPGSYEAAEQGADQSRVLGLGGRALVLLRRRRH